MLPFFFFFSKLYSHSFIARTFPALLGYGATLAALMGAFEFTGGSLFGYKVRDLNVDEFERREALRTTYRKPMEETIAQIGEGRGVLSPTRLISRSL